MTPTPVRGPSDAASNEPPQSGEHNARLSGYLDGELTQQDRQALEVRLVDEPELQAQLDELRAVRDRVRGASLNRLSDSQWREMMHHGTAQATLSLGWLLFIGGIVAASGIALYGLLQDSATHTGIKLVIGAIYLGLALLLLSVLRQRLLERKTDKYKDVEI